MTYTALEQHELGGDKVIALPGRIAFPKFTEPKTIEYKDGTSKQVYTAWFLLDSKDPEQSQAIKEYRHWWATTYLGGLGIDNPEDLTETQRETLALVNGPKMIVEWEKSAKQAAAAEKKEFDVDKYYEKGGLPQLLRDGCYYIRVQKDAVNRRTGTALAGPTVYVDDMEVLPANVKEKLKSGDVGKMYLSAYMFKGTKDNPLARVIHRIVAFQKTADGESIGGEFGDEAKKKDLSNLICKQAAASSAAAPAADTKTSTIADDEDFGDILAAN